MTSWTGSTGAEDLGDFEKVSECSWVLARKKTVDFRLLAEALGRCRTRSRGAGRWKSQNRKNVYHSPYVEEPLNSKVIKSFVPELRSRKCFSCFEIPMFYVYMLWTLWTFCVPVWICPIPVFISGCGTFDDTFKTDNHILFIESRPNGLIESMVRNFIQQRQVLFLKYIKTNKTSYRICNPGLSSNAKTWKLERGIEIGAYTNVTAQPSSPNTEVITLPIRCSFRWSNISSIDSLSILCVF